MISVNIRDIDMNPGYRYISFWATYIWCS